MKEEARDLFDPRAAMDSDFSSTTVAGDGGDHRDFAFAFDNNNFSDRLLRIEIVGDPPESNPGGDACLSIADWARNRKRRREDVVKKEEAGEIFFFFEGTKIVFLMCFYCAKWRKCGTFWILISSLVAEIDVRDGDHVLAGDQADIDDDGASDNEDGAPVAMIGGSVSGI